MRTAPSRISDSSRASPREADKPAAAVAPIPHTAVVAGTFKTLGFAAGGVLDQVKRARENAQKVMNEKGKRDE